MKSQNLTLLTVSIIIAILIVGCAQTSPRAIETSTSVMTTAPIATIVPSPSVSAILTATPLPTIIPTLVPTLPAKEAEEKFIQLLSDNGGCRLPCVWGITPGESTYQEAQTILLPLSGISGLLPGFLPDGGAIFPNYVGDLNISSRVGFNVDTLTNSRIVSRIGFEARVFNSDERLVYDSVFFGGQLRPYMLSAVLSDQGLPAAVMVSTYKGLEQGKHIPGFDVVLLYPEQGILAIYTTSRQLVGGNIRACLANAHVRMYLSPVGEPDAFAEMLAQTHQWGFLWPDPQDNSYWKHIETATSFTAEEFYETFRQPTDMCIETPANLWPTPDN